MRKHHIALLVAGAALHSITAHSAEPSKRTAQPDIKFLEYLGSLEGNEENWTDVANAEALASSTPSAAKQSNTQSKPDATKKTEATTVVESK